MANCLLNFWPLIIIYAAAVLAVIVLLAFVLSRIERRQLVKRMHEMRSEQDMRGILPMQ